MNSSVVYLYQRPYRQTNECSEDRKKHEIEQKRAYGIYSQVCTNHDADRER